MVYCVSAASITMEEIKKAERKRKKFAARIKTSKGILCSDIPGPYVGLCNVGQATGLQKEALHSIVRQQLPAVALPKFIAEKGESHSFLVFKNALDADLFCKVFDSKVKIEEDGPPIYTVFVDSVPNTEVVCQHNPPNGLYIINDFISKEEEIKFIEMFDWSEEKEANLKNRQVKHYGFAFRYGSNDVDLNSPLIEKIPSECNILWKKLESSGIEIYGKPDQMTINKYLPGQGIPSHVDKHSPFGATILSLSLGGDVVMDWRHHSGKNVPVLVPARSMLVMQDEARYDWQHGIQSRPWDPIIEKRNSENGNTTVITSDTLTRETRISLTFRWTRQGTCECRFKTLCDSVDRSAEMDDKMASNLEELHVHQVYEEIAGHFSSTRHTPWPRVVEFVSSATAGTILLDLGAGNGKNILPRSDIFQLACERSSGLLSECARHVPAAAACARLDVLRPGLRGACADLVICIAVIHHFSSQQRRLQSIATIADLLRTGGKALVTVWAKDQTKSNYLCKNKSTVQSEESHTTACGLSLPVHENRTQFQHNDLLVPWKLRKEKQDNTLLRYYHVFEEGELEQLCNEVPNIKVVSSFYEEGNWCVIFEKNIAI